MKTGSPALVWFCASNSTHLEMWECVASALRARRQDVRIEVLSFGRYYGPIRGGRGTLARLVTEVPRPKAARFYWECGPIDRVKAIWMARQKIESLLDARKPRLVVLGNDTGALESVVLSLARSRSIPTLLVQDGILGSGDHRRAGLVEAAAVFGRMLLGLPTRRLYGTGGATRIAVTGKYARELMRERGVPDQRLLVTGQPRLDRLMMPPRPTQSRRQQADVTRRPPVIAFFSQPMVRYGYMRPEQWDKVVLSVFSAAAELRSKYSLLVKLHPAEQASQFEHRYAGQLAACGARVLTQIDLAALLKRMDVAVVYTSTIALEAMVLGKPVVLISPGEVVDVFGFGRLNAALVAHDAPQLAAQIRKSLWDRTSQRTLARGRRRAIAEHLGRLDGKASFRVARVIESMVSDAG